MNLPRDTPIAAAASQMRKKGMSTRDILKTLCDMNKVTNQLSDMAAVIATDMKAAKINERLQTIKHLTEKIIDKSKQRIQEDIDLIGINPGTKQFYDGFERQSQTLNKQLESAISKRESSRTQCEGLIKDLKNEINLYLNDEEKARANKSAFFKKIQPIDKQLNELDKTTVSLMQMHETLNTQFKALSENIERVANTLKTGGPTSPDMRPE